MGTILRAYNDLGEKYDLDVFNEQQFLLDISAIESGDIGRVFGISSQTFALPPTPNNNEYFGNLFDLGASYPSGSLTNTSTAPTTFIKTMPCQVLNDGVAIFNGRLYLDSVITDEDGDTIYNVNVVNETIDFKYQIQDLTFGDLDWSDYNHSLTIGNITGSWTNDLFGGEIVYPLVEYGSQPNDNTATELKNGGGARTFTNEASPIHLDTFKPAIRLKSVMDKVFNTLDYKYTSSLFESSYMDSVYMLSSKDTSKGTSFVNPLAQTFKAETSTAYNAGIIVQPIEADTELYDNAGNYDNTTFQFTAGETGTYSFDANLSILFTAINQPQIPRTLYFELSINGSATGIQPVWYNLKGISNNYTKNFTANWNGLTLQTGDVVEIGVAFSNATLAVPEFATINPSSYVECYQSPTTTIGGNVNLAGIFDEETSVLDWLNGVIQKFNLVIEPLADNPKVIQVETFNDWVDAGATKDWTDIVDRSVKWEIKHPLAGNPRKLYFSDEEDKDSANQWSIQNLDKIFGDYTYTSESDLANGEKRIGEFFAPTPMKFIEGTDTFIIPRIYTLKDGRKEPFVFKPRLLHFVGIKNATELRGRDASGNSTIGEYYILNESQVVETFTSYPQFHHNSAVPANEATSLDLHFGNGGHWEYHQAQANAFAKRDAFYEYWAFYVNELYDIDARLLTLNVALKPTDIPTIALNDKIFIDGHYYRINKISGANLTNEQSTKVELIKALPRKSHFPRRRIFYDDFGGYDDVYLPDFELTYTGSVVYYDWNSDTPITSSVVNEKAGYRDGLYVYSGSVNYGTPIQPIEPNNNIIFGKNQVDDRATNIVVMGGGNQVSSDASNLHIVGNGNTIQDTATNTAIFGDNNLISEDVGQTFIVNTTDTPVIVPSGSSNIIALNPVNPITDLDNGKVIIGNAKIQGSIFEDYTNVEVGDSSTTWLTGSTWDNTFHFHFQYTSSVNGTAQVWIETPLSASTDGEQKRFTTDGSLTASKIVNIAPYTGSIEGNPEKTLTTPYDGLTIAQINNEWQVIQEKAK